MYAGWGHFMKELLKAVRSASAGCSDVVCDLISDDASESPGEFKDAISLHLPV